MERKTREIVKLATLRAPISFGPIQAMKKEMVKKREAQKADM